MRVNPFVCAERFLGPNFWKPRSKKRLLNRGNLTICGKSAHMTPATSRKLTVLALCGSCFLLLTLLAPGGPTSGFPYRRRNTEMPIGTVKFFNESKGYGF